MGLAAVSPRSGQASLARSATSGGTPSPSSTGFASTSNLAAQQIFGIPTAGTAAHAFTLLHDREADAFAAQIKTLGVGTTLLVDTYDINAGVKAAIEVAEQSKQRAVREREQVVQQLLRVYVANGMRLLESDQLSEALPWLGEALPWIPTRRAAAPETIGVLKDVPQVAANVPQG